MGLEDSTASSSRRSVLLLAGAIVISTSLHVVPQLLRDVVDPAWSMLVLMIVDACIVALVVRSKIAVLTGLLLGLLLAATMFLHQQVLAALPSIVLNLMLAGVFAATLRRGETPLIVRIEELDNASELTPQFVRYLRVLTVAWTLFFLANAVLSLALILLAPFEWWSLFSNVLTWPLIGAMFAAEWVVRRIAYPELPPHTPLNIAAKIFAYRRRSGARTV